jgi:hypothetical protein
MQMKRFIILVLAILPLTLLSPVDAREPTAPKTKRTNPKKSSSKELVWDASKAEERIQHYNVYEKIIDKNQKVTWKKIGSANEARYKIRHLSPGTHIYAVTAVSSMGESQRSPELVVEN